MVPREKWDMGPGLGSIPIRIGIELEFNMNWVELGVGIEIFRSDRGIGIELELRFL